MKRKIFITFICSFLSCLVLFIGVLFLFSRENLTGVDVPKTDEPYGKTFLPSNTVVLFTFPDACGVAISLDFENSKTVAAVLKTPDKEAALDFGFEVEYTAECDYPFMMDFIDTLGGIELDNYRYTGVQVCNMLASFKDDVTLRANILNAVFEKIAKYGLSQEALYCIIEDTKTNLSVPACYGWCENSIMVFSSINILNER
ncbi:MAG: hypothetical protein E7568_04745 [Ruminococcaceae bacterium]|nr:hypothetical protein [Oscillospiraceae bacterium]